MRKHTIFSSYQRLLLLPVMLLAGCAGPEASKPETAATPAAVAATARTVTGQITERSGVPEAGRSRYPDCYYTAGFRVDESAAAAGMPHVITLVLPGFLDRRVTPEDGFSAGDRLRVTVAAFETLDETAQSVRIADTLGDLTSPWYWCFRAEKLSPEE